MKTYKIFETERLLIRPTTIEDAPFILELLNTPKWIEFIGDRNLKTIKDAENYIQDRMLPQLQKLGFSNNTVILKATNEKIGSCGLYDRDGIEGVDIGFAFLPKFENKGFGYESAKELILAAQKDFNFKKVNAITTENNYASQKLIEKLGLKLKGKTNLPNDTETLLLYCIEF